MSLTVTDLEREIFEIEEIRVVIRANKSEIFNNYSYQRKTASNTSITDWYNTRLKPLIGEVEATVIDGNGNMPHGRRNIETVRDSYIKK